MKLTLDQLIAITTLYDCTRCGLRHAAVRTCDEARLEYKVMEQEAVNK